MTTLNWAKDPSAPNAPNVDNAVGNPNGGSGGACGTNGTGGTINLSTLPGSALIYVDGNVTVQDAATNPGFAGFATIVAGDDTGTGPMQWSKVTANLSAGSKTACVGSDPGWAGESTGVGVTDSAGVLPAGTTVKVATGGWWCNYQLTFSQAPTMSASSDIIGPPGAGNIIIGGPITYPYSVNGAQHVLTTTTHCDPAWGTGGGVPAGYCPRSDPYDALGLVADYYVQILHTANSCPSPPLTVEAALLALTNSVYAENWTGGALCHLDLFGAIGQDFRGPVGLIGYSGYEKEYYYDTSLQTVWPPYYLQATSSGWEPVGYAEGRAGAASRALAGVAYAAGCGSQC